MTNESIIQETALEFHVNETLNSIMNLHISEMQPYMFIVLYASCSIRQSSIDT